jgi:hypothetical protein
MTSKHKRDRKKKSDSHNQNDVPRLQKHKKKKSDRSHHKKLKRDDSSFALEGKE